VRGLRGFVLAAALAGPVVPAAAQTPAAGERPSRGSIEASGGVLWQAGFDLGERTAQLTRNGDPSAGPFDLFTTRTEVEPIAGFQARVAYYLTSALAVEGGVQYSRPILSVRLSADVEEAEDLTAEETMSRYLFDGSVVYHLMGLAFAGRSAVPFVTAGAGHLRELHEENELVETGTEFHGGAGLKYWFGGAGRRFGLRGEVGFSSRDGGSDFGEGRRTVPVAQASFVYLF
jgi:hypothetical protein